MGYNANGTNVTSRIAFNSGTIDFGANRLVNVNDVNISIKWTNALLYVLNSIKAANIARHSLSVSLSGNISSFSKELEMLSLGSSTAGSPLEIDALDGQPTLLNPVVTFFDSNNNQYQYQLINALFSSDTMALTQDAYGKWSFTIDATDIKILSAA